MKALLVYPRYPESFWSFKYALKFIGVKAAYPPLGLLTVAAMLPPEWEKRLIDLNVKPLTNADLQWADYVFISAMAIQRESVKEIIARCKSLGVKVVAGGPLFTMEPEEYDEVDHLVLNEAEITLPRFLADLEAGKAEHLYTTDQHPDLEQTPVP
ncbi:MAG: cobalamin-dependent protein, partial [Desulfofundulus sp.]